MCSSDLEASAATTEIARRILAASDSSGPRASTLASSSFSRKALPFLLCLLIPTFALGTYLKFGDPGLPAQPFADRAPPSDRQQTAALPDLIVRARARLAAAPGDPEAMSSLAELLTAESQGTVPKEARELFEQAAKADPDDPRAGYYLGLHQAQSGDSRAALDRWLALAGQIGRAHV